MSIPTPETQRPLCPDRESLVWEAMAQGAEMPSFDDMECSGADCPGPKEVGGCAIKLYGLPTIRFGGKPVCGREYADVQAPQKQRASDQSGVPLHPESNPL